MSAFDDPPPRLDPTVALGFDLLATAAQVEDEAALLGQAPRGGVVVALVEAQMLGRPLGRFGPGDGPGVQGLAHQEVVVDVGARDDDTDRHAAPVSEDRALDPTLAAVGGIGAGFSPTHGRLARGSVQR